MSKKMSLKELDLMDALDLAVLIEKEAQERYLEFARQIGSSSEKDAGAFFSQMAINEEKHAVELSDKRQKLFGDRPSRISPESMYQYQEIEAPEFDRAESYMSARKALLVARDCEIKAHDFFKNAERLVSDLEVKALFRELMGEELEHKKMVEEILEKNHGTISPDLDSEDIDEPNGL